MENSKNSRAALGPMGILLLIIGMIFGTRIPSGSGGGEDKTGPSGSGTSGNKAGGNEGKETTGPDFRQPYLEFRDGLTVASSLQGLDKAPASRRLGTLLAQDAAQQPIDPEFLIVTLPDPIDSRVGYVFDTTLDAVQMAVEARGWDLDRFWLPWWPSSRPLRGHSDVQPVEVSGARTESSLQTSLYERQPGCCSFASSVRPTNRNRCSLSSWSVRRQRGALPRPH
jgi:hypothetical protein